jgi:hypothetical protein
MCVYKQVLLHYDKKVETVMVKGIQQISENKNYLSLQIIEHNKTHIC